MRSDETGQDGPDILYKPDSDKPYDKDELKGVSDFVDGIAGKVVTAVGTSPQTS